MGIFSLFSSSSHPPYFLKGAPGSVFRSPERLTYCLILVLIFFFFSLVAFHDGRCLGTIPPPPLTAVRIYITGISTGMGGRETMYEAMGELGPSIL